MARTSDTHSSPRHDHHSWESRDYVLRWAEGQDPKEKHREEPFLTLANIIPFGKTEPIRILDLGAGYGALTQFLLGRFPNATAICQDGSQEMAKLGHERMKALKGRYQYVICDFSNRGWSRYMPGRFEVVVSSIAIHNVRAPKTIQHIYEESYGLINSGGCFLNFDRPRPPWEDQMNWLRDAGFENVNIFWRNESRAVFGGFKGA